MRLHYMNLFFALLGYRVFTVEAATSMTGELEHPAREVVVLSKRSAISPATQMDTIRLSDSVLIEKE
jgi:hypothetical protein